VVVIIDDGSTDDTAAVARRHGVDHVVSLGHNQGLARAFMAGLEASLKLGADVILNTDADNQYSAKSIPALVRPILDGKALLVIGARPIARIEHFSPVKKAMQKLGSWVVRLASGTKVADAPSGFRAIHRDAAIRMNVLSAYTYTLETIIQAGRSNVRVVTVPIEVNGFLRPSRLISGVSSYIWRSILTILRIFVIYRPLRFFGVLALICAIPAIVAIARFLYFYAVGQGDGHVQSLVLAATSLAAASAGLSVDLNDYLSITGIVCAAFVVGLITPGAPAGMGVREAIIVLALQHTDFASHAVVVALSPRIATLGGDLLLGLAGFLIVRRGASTRSLPPTLSEDHAA
jgi:Glycosyl transferase family 2